MFPATLSTVSKRPRQHTVKEWREAGELPRLAAHLNPINVTKQVWQRRQTTWQLNKRTYLIHEDSQLLGNGCYCSTIPISKQKKYFITTTYSAPRDPGSIIINQKRFNYRETHWNAIVSELQNGSRRQFLGFIAGKNKQSLISTWADQDRRKETFVYAQLLPADVWSHLHSAARRFDFKGCVCTQDDVFVEYPDYQLIYHSLSLSNIWG